MNSISSQLLPLKDADYRNFMLPLVPSVDPGRIIGVRTPALRALAKRIAGTPQAQEFMSELPHMYFEEDNLHGFLIERISSFDLALEETERFLPFIDNWATCDQTNPKALTLDPNTLLEHVHKWLRSEHTYTVRFGIETLMRHYLGDRFDPEYPELVASVKSDEYYVNMMSAWYFATALAMRYENIIGYLEQRRLSGWVHNKTIQKAVESRRITAEQKVYLRTLRIKLPN